MSIVAFAEAMRVAGIPPPDAIIADGQLHRFPTNGKRDDDSGWYVLHDDNSPVGQFGDWRTGGEATTWRGGNGHTPTPAEVAAQRKRITDAERQREADERKRHARSRDHAAAILGAATGDATQHPYAKLKRADFGPLVKRGAWPQRGWSDALLVPMYDAQGVVQTIEAISADGEKDFLRGGKKRGAFHPFGKIRGASHVLIGEGLATVMACVVGVEWPAAAAMDAGNLIHVANIVRELAPDAQIVIVADNDVRDDGTPNTGIEAANRAAAAVGGRVAIPILDGRKCDFWDVWSEAGIEPLKQAIANAKAPEVSAAQPSRNNATASDLAGREWPEPQPIPAGLPPVEAFDLNMLPVCLRAWIGDIADRVQCAPDYVAIAAAAAMGAVLGRKVAIRPQARTDWSEVANQWGLIIGRPGVLKSPAIEQALVPLRRLEAQARDRFSAEQDAFRAQSIIRELRAKANKHDAEKAILKDRRADVSNLLMDDADAGDEPTCERYSTSDTSVESLAELVRLNPNGILVHRDEMVSLLRDLDREEKAGARGFYLTGWNGNTPYTTDRIGRGFNLHTPAVCLSLLGGTQPARIADYVHTATTGGRGDDGLIQRFGLMVWPDMSGEWVNIDRWPDSAARRAASEAFDRLNELDVDGIGAKQDLDVNGAPEGVPYLRFGADALDEFVGWRTDLEHRLRSGEHSPALESHLAKYRKLVPSLALIFHLAEGNRGLVQRSALLTALAWSEYLESHARRIYGSGPASEAAAAKAIMARIHKGDLPAVFAGWQVWRPGWSGLAVREVVASGLALLVDLGHVAQTRIETDGRTATKYEVNPRAQ